MRWQWLLLALALAVCAAVVLRYRSVFPQFERSAYLQRLWESTCTFPLAEENLVFLAHVEDRQDGPSLSCSWRRVPQGVDPSSGIRFAEEVSDIDSRWFTCGDDPVLAAAVWNAVRHPGSNLVHLGEGLRSDASEADILVAKCHYWKGGYCEGDDVNSHCLLPNAAKIMSVAYAVLDTETGEIHW